MILKDAAHLLLHEFGGLTVLRWRHRAEFRIPVFHCFSSSTRANLEAICAHVERHFEPVSLSQIASALEDEVSLPENAISITIDDGYKSFLENGHSIFRRHHIPTTVYVVTGFTDRRLWLWFDQVGFVLEHTSKGFLGVMLGGKTLELRIGSPQEKSDSLVKLLDALKDVPNDERIKFVAGLGSLCDVDVPQLPPGYRAAMTWDELRAISADGVEIGCHTESHPILSRIANVCEIEHEICGAKELMEERLGCTVRHFCYPNGRDVDISELAVRTVVKAGFVTATTATRGLNSGHADRVRLRRIPLDDSPTLRYGVEMLAGLHM
jgi:peptidoglycan/xylan/chitin deacetylase (PgdA/CDA1 family)